MDLLKLSINRFVQYSSGTCTDACNAEEQFHIFLSLDLEILIY